MAANDITVRIDIAGLQQEFGRSVQRCVDLVSFGLISAEKLPEQELVLPGSRFQLQDYGPRDFNTARTSFCEWVLAAGFQDLIAAVNGLLEQVRLICAIWSLGPATLISGTDWRSAVVGESTRFHRLGLPHKLAFLVREHGFNIDDKLARVVLSINAARNCFIHRGGIVSEGDVNQSDCLAVRWIRIGLFTTGPDGGRELVPPACTAEGEGILARTCDGSKLFSVGERIGFSAQEFAEICWSCAEFSAHVASELESYGRLKGIEVDAGGSDGSEG
jgi:hypothetical protein